MIERNGAEVCAPLKPIRTKLGKIIRRINCRFPLFFDHWYYQRAINCDQFDLCIIESSVLLFPLARKLAKTKKCKKIVIWNENSCLGTFRDFGLRRLGIVFSSFDQRDCKNFGLIYNNDFLFQNMMIGLSNEKYDFLFVGQDKGRKPLLDELERKLISYGFSVKFYIVDSTHPYINYETYLSLAKSSRVLVDVVQQGQFGLSLRPIESMYLGIKLLTNNESIISSDLNDSNNVLFFSDSNIPEKEVIDFLNRPVSKYSRNEINKYDFAHWINKYF